MGSFSCQHWFFDTANRIVDQDLLVKHFAVIWKLRDHHPAAHRLIQVARHRANLFEVAWLPYFELLLVVKDQAAVAATTGLASEGREASVALQFDHF